MSRHLVPIRKVARDELVLTERGWAEGYELGSKTAAVGRVRFVGSEGRARADAADGSWEFSRSPRLGFHVEARRAGEVVASYRGGRLLRGGTVEVRGQPPLAWKLPGLRGGPRILGLLGGQFVLAADQGELIRFKASMLKLRARLRVSRVAESRSDLSLLALLGCYLVIRSKQLSRSIGRFGDGVGGDGFGWGGNGGGNGGGM